MKKFNLIYTLILSGFLITSCSQSKFIVAPPFTDVEKISTIETGQSKDDVNKTLGIKPYDLLYLNEGDFLCYYNYRLVGRKVNIDNSIKNRTKGSGATLSSNKAQTAGEPFYTEWRKVYINFKDGKVTHYTTDAGLRNSNYIQLVNGTIKLLNKEDIKLNNFYERSITPGININAESSSEGCCTESIDIDKILFQLKRNGEFKNVGDANNFNWMKNNKK
jgi:hypothetical protein